MNPSAREIIDQLYAARGRTPRGLRPSGGLAPCPINCGSGRGSREDRNPSFSVSEKQGKVLFNCKAGFCTQEQAIEGLRAMGLWEDKKEEQEERITPPVQNYANPFSRTESDAPTIEWEYKTGDEVLAIHGRWDRPDGKEIRWRVPAGTYAEGLGDLRIERLPLYGTQFIDPSDDKPIIIAEGERAVDTLRDHGLNACTAGGGAGQRSFSRETLAPLEDREVWLWPDNDPQGRQFMLFLRQELRTVARSIRLLAPAGLPFKGDAYDWFELGHTAEEISSQEGPAIEHIRSDAIKVSIPLELSETGGSVVFLWENMRSQRGRLDADLTLTPPHSAILTENHKLKRRINLKSSSGITALRRECESAFSDEIDWATIVPRSVSLASEALVDAESNSAIDLAKYKDRQKHRWLIDGFIPLNASTMLFGTGANLKTLTAHSMLLHLATGQNWLGFGIDRPRNCLVLDYEAFEDSWLDYQDRLIEGMAGIDAVPEGRIYYLPAMGVSLNEQIEKVLAQIESARIEVLLVDSGALACGNDPNDSDAALSYFRALQRCMEQGVTTITLGHTTKASRTNKDAKSETNYALGSIMWHNSSRCTYYVESTQAEGRNDFYTVAMQNKKMNLAAPPQPFGIEFLFKDPEGPIYVVKE